MKKIFSPERRKLAYIVMATTAIVIGGLHLIVVGIFAKDGILSDWWSTTEINKEMTSEESAPKDSWSPTGSPEEIASSTPEPTSPTVATPASTSMGAGMSGKEIYEMMCAACHGMDGKEGPNPALRTPSLNNPDTLATASDSYLRHIIDKGRSGSAMPPWGPAVGLLSYEDIDKVVAHIRAWEGEGADPTTISASNGDILAGRDLYLGLCANCHAPDGSGGVGISINSPTFLGIATDQFLADTIINGRPGTAMASWKHLDAQSVSDIVAYIRTWQAKAPALSEVERSLKRYSVEDNRDYGEGLFSGMCAACHGKEGKGGIGVRLNGENIVPAMSTEFLYKTITQGRPATAMPAWPQLNADQIAGLITFMRSWQDESKFTLAKAPVLGTLGNENKGRNHYALACASCHGSVGEGGVGPRLTNAAFLATASNDVLYEWIAHGRTGTPMEGFLKSEQGIVELTSKEIMDVIAFLRFQGARETAPLVQTGLGDPVFGKQFYDGSCASCHGYDGEGASAPQLRNPTFLKSASDGFLQATIAMGRDGTAMLPMIHGYQGLGQLDPNNIYDIIAYMRLWQKEDRWEAHRPVAEQSARAISKGKEYYSQYCSGCHGPNGLGSADGQGYFAPALNNKEFLEAASDGFLQATIARGRSNTPMRPFAANGGGIASLDAESIFDIVSYIRSWQDLDLPKGD